MFVRVIKGPQNTGHPYGTQNVHLNQPNQCLKKKCVKKHNLHLFLILKYFIANATQKFLKGAGTKIWTYFVMTKYCWWNNKCVHIKVLRINEVEQSTR